MIHFAPIVLFVYNRPTHTKETLENLQKCSQAQDSILYIFSDGAKTKKQVPEVSEVRAVLQETWNFKEVHIIPREKNMGLAASVIDGVTTVIQKHKTVIVLEDDVLLSPHTLEYFNHALQQYENKVKVMHIGSYMYPIENQNLPETFFTRLVSSQAWATWDRAWLHFQPNINQIISQFDTEKIKRFTFDNTMNFWKQIRTQQAGTIDSWAVRWYASVFLNGGLGLQCSSSLISNTGHDGSGVHSSISTMFNTEVKTDKVTYYPTDISENKQAYQALKKYFKNRKGSLFTRTVRFLNNKIFKIR